MARNRIKKALALVATGALALAGVSLGFAAWPFTEGEKPTLAPLLAQVTPAVVNVSVVSNAPRNPVLSNPELRRFFEIPEGMPENAPSRQGVGSGVIVDAQEGIILSNHHVIADAREIVVVLSDRRQFKAEVVGSDAATDIAVLDIDAEGLTELQFADSETLEVGDYVVAIGNPFGLGQTATAGIVSALGRTGINVNGYEDFIQTDASINPGNSGGALVDLSGGLMGINTAIVSATGTNVGIGFAIPSEMARAVMDRIIEHGEVRRGQLGVLIQDVTPELAEALTLSINDGAIVADVLEGSPAEAAGLVQGDIIVSVNGDAVANAAELRNEIGFVEPGSPVELGVVRGDERLDIAARVAIEPEAIQEPGPAAGDPASVLGGAEVQNLGPEHPLFEQSAGVLVTGVAPGSRAALSGLMQQDLILAVNREPVTTVDALRQTLDEATGAVALTILRDGRQLFLVMR